MNKKEELLRKIKERAAEDERNRRDPRFLGVMGFLVAKGLLRADFALPLRPNKKLFLADAIWAGQNVEPRILEVLPAAVLRLGAHFDYDPAKHPELAAVLAKLKEGAAEGPEFFGMPYPKVKAWLALPLKDKRVKPLGEHKVMKTFRLHPEAVVAIRQLAAKAGCSEAEVIERRILGRG